MTTAMFDPAGGPLVVEVLSAQAQPGSYTILLWEAEVNHVVFTARGNFLNPDDDAHELPGACTDHEGRMAEVLATVVVTPPIDEYSVSLRVMQDDRELARETQAGEGVPLGTVTVDLFIELAAADGGGDS
jgi:hypothetical protein